MIAVSNKPTKKKLITYGLVITLMIIGNLIIYYRNADQTDLEDDLGLSEDFSQKSDKNLSGERTVLDHNLFIALKKIGDWPIVPKNVGKADPFAPIFNQ